MSVAASATDSPRLLLRPREAARALGIGQTSFYALLRDGKLKAKKVGKATLIARSEIDRFISELPPAR